MTTFLRVILVLNSVAFLLTAVLTFLRPDAVAGSLGLGIDGARGRNELLANYGGLYAGIGLILAYGAWRCVRPAALVLAICCAGLALGRLIAHLHGGPAAPVQLAYLGWEGLTAGLVAAVLCIGQPSAGKQNG
jgi:hypothetical protein